MTMNPRAAFLAATALVLSVAAQSASISGDVKSGGKPVRGALVTLFTADTRVSETVLSDDAGHYTLSTNLS